MSFWSRLLGRFFRGFLLPTVDDVMHEAVTDANDIIDNLDPKGKSTSPVVPDVHDNNHG